MQKAIWGFFKYREVKSGASPSNLLWSNVLPHEMSDPMVRQQPRLFDRLDYPVLGSACWSKNQINSKRMAARLNR